MAKIMVNRSMLMAIEQNLFRWLMKMSSNSTGWFQIQTQPCLLVCVYSVYILMKTEKGEKKGLMRKELVNSNYWFNNREEWGQYLNTWIGENLKAKHRLRRCTLLSSNFYITTHYDNVSRKKKFDTRIALTYETETSH